MISSNEEQYKASLENLVAKQANKKIWNNLLKKQIKNN